MDTSKSPENSRNSALRGTVFSGEGVGRKFIELAWVRQQIHEKLGFDPYRGTLNLRLSRAEAQRLERILSKAKRIEITPDEGFCRGWAVRVWLTNQIDAAIIIPEKPQYPSDVLEIIAPVSLRQALSLKDGDTLEVRVQLDKKPRI